ncbi:unnamed protein product, partial [Darwinula stevensoni]
MYCLQWLLPVLLMPKPMNPALFFNHAMFMLVYLIGFYLEKKPCTICSLIFMIAFFLICYNCFSNCIICFSKQCSPSDSSSCEYNNKNMELSCIKKEVDALDIQIAKLQHCKRQLLERKESLLQSIRQEKITELESQDWQGKGSVLWLRPDSLNLLLKSPSPWSEELVLITGFVVFYLEFPWSKEIKEALRGKFKLEKFRDLQLAAINASLSRHDVILIMPTGGGKSLVYQLPAVVSQGVTLVVSPLVSLMEDQIMALHKLQIHADMLNASCSREKVSQILNALIDKHGDLKLLYVTPEKMAKSKRFMSKLQKCYELGLLARVAIDEVHCCSQWGHDFRPDYKFLGILRSMFPKTPILGLTATATSNVTEDVKEFLNIPQAMVFKSSFNRPNLYYEVQEKSSSLKDSLDILSSLLTQDFAGQSGIIYTLTIRESEELTTELQKRGLQVGCYHANLEAKTRSDIHQKWLQNEIQAVVATVAFGMGIDKPDVRFVIHHCMSKSMENFYQESGRAGRDEERARCIVLFRFADIFRISTMVFTERTGLTNLYSMVSYCLDSY